MISKLSPRGWTRTHCISIRRGFFANPGPVQGKVKVRGTARDVDQYGSPAKGIHLRESEGIGEYQTSEDI